MCFLLKNKQTMGKKNTDGLVPPAILMPLEIHGTKFKFEQGTGEMMSSEEINLLMHTRNPVNMRDFLGTHNETSITELVNTFDGLYKALGQHIQQLNKEIKTNGSNAAELSARNGLFGTMKAQVIKAKQQIVRAWGIRQKAKSATGDKQDDSDAVLAVLGLGVANGTVLGYGAAGGVARAATIGVQVQPTPPAPPPPPPSTKTTGYKRTYDDMNPEETAYVLGLSRGERGDYWKAADEFHKAKEANDDEIKSLKVAVKEAHSVLRSANIALEQSNDAVKQAKQKLAQADAEMRDASVLASRLHAEAENAKNIHDLKAAQLKEMEN